MPWYSQASDLVGCRYEWISALVGHFKPLPGGGCATGGLQGGQLLTSQIELLHVNILSRGCLLTQQVLIVWY